MEKDNIKTVLGLDLNMKEFLKRANRFSNTNEFVVENIQDLKKSNEPEEDGLFSEEIFGKIGSSERNALYGYITLGIRVIHPAVFDILSKKYKEAKLMGLIDGTSCIVNHPDGFTIVPTDSVDETMLSKLGVSTITMKTLMANWYKLNWPKGSPTWNQFVKAMQKPRTDLADAIFPNIMIVRPAGYRDIQIRSDLTGTISSDIKGVPEENELYKNVIKATKPFKSDLYDFSGTEHTRLQKAVNDLYEYFISRFPKKENLPQKTVTQKTLEGVGRLVITGSDPSTGSNYKNTASGMNYIGIPLHIYIQLNRSRMIHEYNNFIQNIEQLIDADKMSNGEKSIMNKVNLEELYSTITDTKFITDAFENYTNSEEFRVRPLMIKSQYIRIEPIERMFNRKTTYMDLFYLLATKITSYKETSIARYVRYPILDEKASQFGHPTILTLERKVNLSQKYKKMVDEYYKKHSEEYPNYWDMMFEAFMLVEQNPRTMNLSRLDYQEYPLIDVDDYTNNKTKATAEMNNAAIANMGADFDGDQISVEILKTKEAIDAGLSIMRSPSNFMGSSGSNIRSISGEPGMSIVNLLR